MIHSFLRLIYEPNGPVELMVIHFSSLTLGNQSLLLTCCLSACDALFRDEIISPDCWLLFLISTHFQLKNILGEESNRVEIEWRA